MAWAPSLRKETSAKPWQLKPKPPGQPRGSKQRLMQHTSAKELLPDASVLDFTEARREPQQMQYETYFPVLNPYDMINSYGGYFPMQMPMPMPMPMHPGSSPFGPDPSSFMGGVGPYNNGAMMAIPGHVSLNPSSATGWSPPTFLPEQPRQEHSSPPPVMTSSASPTSAAAGGGASNQFGEENERLKVELELMRNEQQRLRFDLDNQKTKRENQKQVISQQRSEMEQMREGIDQQRREMQQMREGIEMQREALGGQRQQIEALQFDLEHCKMDVESARHEAEQQRLVGEAHKADAERKARHLQSLDSECARLEHELSTSKAKMQEVQDSTGKLLDVHTSTQDQFLLLKEQNLKLKGFVQDLTLKIHGYERDLAAKDRESEGLQSKRRSLEEATNILRGEMKDTKRVLKKTAEVCETQQHLVDDLQKKLKEATRRDQEHALELKSLAASYEDKIQKLDVAGKRDAHIRVTQSESVAARATERLEAKEAQLKDVTNKLEAVSAKAAVLEQDLASARRKSASLKEQLAFDAKIKELNAAQLQQLRTMFLELSESQKDANKVSKKNAAAGGGLAPQHLDTIIKLLKVNQDQAIAHHKDAIKRQVEEKLEAFVPPQPSQEQRERDVHERRVRDSITAIYLKVNPNKMVDLPRIFAEWAGNLDELLVQVVSKYGKVLEENAYQRD